jgi:hypothetical protein
VVPRPGETDEKNGSDCKSGESHPSRLHELRDGGMRPCDGGRQVG